MFAQIRIEEEVQLSPIEESNFIFTPLYGNLKIFLINPASCQTPNITCNTVVILKTGGINTNVTPGSIPFCPSSWQPIGQVQTTINGLPMNTQVSIDVKKCKRLNPSLPPEWVMIPARLTNFIVNPNQTITAQIYANWNYPDGSEELVGSLELIQTIPPECPNANNNYCTNNISNFPHVKLFLEEDGYASSNMCSENPNALAGITGTYIPEHRNRFSNINNFNLNSLTVCFNTQTQKWQFNFINPEDIEIHLMLDYCEDKLGWYNVIKNFDQIKEIPFYECEKADICFNRHLFPFNVNIGCYLILEVITEHENLHFNERSRDLNKFLSEKYYPNLDAWGAQNLCNSFLNPDEAKQKALNFLKNQFKDLVKQINYDLNKDRADEESTIRDHDWIRDIVRDYLLELYKQC
jgi:hypothetical protein